MNEILRSLLLRSLCLRETHPQSTGAFREINGGQVGVVGVPQGRGQRRLLRKERWRTQPRRSPGWKGSAALLELHGYNAAGHEARRALTHSPGRGRRRSSRVSRMPRRKVPWGGLVAVTAVGVLTVMAESHLVTRAPVLGWGRAERGGGLEKSRQMHPEDGVGEGSCPQGLACWVGTCEDKAMRPVELAGPQISSRTPVSRIFSAASA